MQKLVWQNANGDSIDLTSGNYGITQWEGFSNTSLNIQSQQVPFQDGGVFLDALLEQRELSVTLKMQDNGNLEERYRMRRELIHILNPKLGEGYLIYTNDFTSKRIKCVAQVPLFETHNSNDSGTPSASLAWTACEPYWEDLEETVVSIPAGEIVEIENSGDIPAQVKIEMQGVATNPSIKNDTTGSKIIYNGESDGDIQINTETGNKSVVSKNMVFKLDAFTGVIRSTIFVEDFGKYYAVGESGVLITSTDGISWVFVDIGATLNLNKIIYQADKGIFIIVGAGGNVFVSYDGESWKKSYVGLNRSLQTICYSKNLFVTMSGEYDSKYFTSTDGINWTERDMGVSLSVFGGTYGKGNFYFVGNAQGNTNFGLVSQDGINWTQFSLPQEGNLGYTRIQYFERNDIFILTSSTGKILTSSNGSTWTERYSQSYLLEDVSYSQIFDMFLVVGASGRIISSYDGINWQSQNPVTTKELWSIGVSNNLRQIIINGDIITLVSQDGINWTKKNDFIMCFKSVVNPENKNIIVAVGNNSSSSTTGLIMVSTDGVNWENINISSQVPSSTNLDSITYSKKLDLFVAVGSSGVILTSTDGITWTRRPLQIGSHITCVIYNETTEVFIATTQTNLVLTSDDGITWTLNNSIPIDSFIYAYNKNLYVGVKESKAYTSTDGINWTETVSSGFGSSCVTYSEELELFVSVGSGGVKTSTDGTNWIRRGGYSVRGGLVCYINNMFFVTGRIENSYSVIYSSYDGINWRTILSDTGIKLFSMFFYLNKYFILGLKAILKSDYEYKNTINKITKNSDINFNLAIGSNLITSANYNGNFTNIVKYRQKYIGV